MVLDRNHQKQFNVVDASVSADVTEGDTSDLLSSSLNNQSLFMELKQQQQAKLVIIRTCNGQARLH